MTLEESLETECAEDADITAELTATEMQMQKRQTLLVEMAFEGPERDRSPSRIELFR